MANTVKPLTIDNIVPAFKLWLPTQSVNEEKIKGAWFLFHKHGSEGRKEDLLKDAKHCEILSIYADHVAEEILKKYHKLPVGSYSAGNNSAGNSFSQTTPQDEATHDSKDGENHHSQSNHVKSIGRIQELIKIVSIYQTCLLGWIISAVVAFREDKNGPYCIFSVVGFCLLSLFWFVSGLPLYYSDNLPTGRTAPRFIQSFLKFLRDHDKFVQFSKRVKIFISGFLDASVTFANDLGITRVGDDVALGMWITSLILFVLLFIFNVWIGNQLENVKIKKEKTKPSLHKGISHAANSSPRIFSQDRTQNKPNGSGSNDEYLAHGKGTKAETTMTDIVYR